MNIWLKIVKQLNKNPEDLSQDYQDIVTAYINQYGYNDFRTHVNSVNNKLIQQQQQHIKGFHVYVKRQCVIE